MKEDKYLTIKETGKLLKVTPRTVYNLIYKGLLTKIKIPETKRILIEREEIERFLKQ